MFDILIFFFFTSIKVSEWLLLVFITVQLAVKAVGLCQVMKVDRLESHITGTVNRATILGQLLCEARVHFMSSCHLIKTAVNADQKDSHKWTYVKAISPNHSANFLASMQRFLYCCQRGIEMCLCNHNTKGFDEYDVSVITALGKESATVCTSC